MKSKYAMVLMALLMICRGTSFLFSKNLMNSYEPLNILAVRFLTAFAILIIIFARRIIKSDVRVVAKGFLLGTTYTACMVAEMYGLRYNDTGTSAFIENAAVVIVPIYEMILTRSLPQKMAIVHAVIAFAGVGCLTVAQGASVSVGIWLAILAALIYAICIMLTKYLSKDSDPILIGIWQMGAMGLCSLILSVMLESPRMPQNKSEWSMLLMLILVCSCFGFTFQPLAQKYISVETAGVFSAINPLSTCAVGIIFANEKMGIMKIVGGVLIIFAVLLSVRESEDGK